MINEEISPSVTSSTATFDFDLQSRHLGCGSSMLKVALLIGFSTFPHQFH